jgi:hypothetical protein
VNQKNQSHHGDFSAGISNMGILDNLEAYLSIELDNIDLQENIDKEDISE